MQGTILYSYLQKYRGNCNRKVVRNRYNTPGIIKYPFWQMTAENPRAMYACVNYKEAACPKEIAGRSIVVNADIGDVLSALLGKTDRSDEL